jgi:rhamnogalacturonyl hydrolase YesR
MKKQLFSLFLLHLGVTDFAYANTNKDSLDRLSVKNTLQKTVEWQINHFQYSTEGSPGHLHDYGINAWTNAVLYAGMTEWIKIAGENDSTLNWLQDIGEKSHWAIAENFSQSRYGLYHADELCIGQFFLEMYGKYKDEEMLKSTKNRLDWIIANPPDTSLLAKNKQSWTWCDALFMAPPVYARMAALTQDDKYLQFMDKQFKNTYFHLYNKAEKLFFRDDSYFDKREENNRNVFWGRGNGWVAAGLVNILKQLPDHSPYRPFYENLFREFVPQLVALQD